MNGVLVIAVAFLVLSSDVGVRGEDMTTATCTIVKNSGLAPVYGTITFSQEATGGDTRIEIKLQGFNVSSIMTQHGFHVHEFGSLSEKCNDAGAHYNPLNKTHGAPSDQNRHVGDLGNVNVSVAGEVDSVITDSIVSLVGQYSVLGKAIVVHETFDDLGKGGHSDSNTTGHAGKRFGCCVIFKDETSSANRWRSTSSVFGSLALLISRVIG